MASTSEPPTLRAWRLVKERHAETAFDGEGARLYGGRWNSPGKRVVYTSGALSLAALETLVHLDPALSLPRFLAFSVHIQESDITSVMLPANYAMIGPLPALTITRQLGDQWIDEGRYLALSVPSAIVPQEFNILLNPLHPRFVSLVISPPVAFAVDARFRR
jgi:RES domain-containing protein